MKQRLKDLMLLMLCCIPLVLAVEVQAQTQVPSIVEKQNLKTKVAKASPDAQTTEVPPKPFVETTPVGKLAKEEKGKLGKIPFNRAVNTAKAKNTGTLSTLKVQKVPQLKTTNNVRGGVNSVGTAKDSKKKDQFNYKTDQFSSVPPLKNATPIQLVQPQTSVQGATYSETKVKSEGETSPVQTQNRP